MHICINKHQVVVAFLVFTLKEAQLKFLNIKHYWRMSDFIIYFGERIGYFPFEYAGL